MKRLVEIMKKAGECSESMKVCHSQLQELSLALVKIADDTERDIRLEVGLLSCITTASNEWRAR